MDRRLTAILAADVAGYSRLLRIDEAGTLSVLKAHRKELIDGKVAEHRGRIVKLMGDGMLMEFPSVLDAVACATEIQRRMGERNLGIPGDRKIEYRIGIHLGDIVIEEDDIYGDGLNVASRIEGVAQPGGIAVSAAVRESIGNRLDVVFEDLGEYNLKNIDRPVRIYNVSFGALPRAPTFSDETGRKLSIAVLPFTNMSGDPEQEYFVDGLVEDVITGLAKMPGLFVIARNSSFTYKGKVGRRQAGRERAGRSLCAGGQRSQGREPTAHHRPADRGIDGTHVWADKFEGSLEDMFDLQDRLTERIVGAIEPSLRRAEINRARNKRPDSLDAYDLFLRAMPHAYANTAPEGRGTAYYLEVLRLDANYAAAHAFKAWCHEQRYFRSGFTLKTRRCAGARQLGDEVRCRRSASPQHRCFRSRNRGKGARGRDRRAQSFAGDEWKLRPSLRLQRPGACPARKLRSRNRACRTCGSPEPIRSIQLQCIYGAGIFVLPYRALRGWVTFANLAIQSNPTLGPCHAMLVANLVMADRLDAARQAVSGCWRSSLTPPPAASSAPLGPGRT